MATQLLGFLFWVLVGSECKPQTAPFHRSWEVPEGAGQTRVVAKMGFKKGEWAVPCDVETKVVGLRVPPSCGFKFTQ